MSRNVAASVRARLLARARARGEEFERTLTQFAAERLLYRLGASSHRDRFILKGASLLAVWMPDPYRVTRDIDVLAFGTSDDEAIRTLFADVCAVACPDDGLSFDIGKMRVEPIRAEEEYVGRRARFLARLGSARINVQVDIGYGDAVGPAWEEIDYPVLIDGLPAPRLRGYAREASVA